MPTQLRGGPAGAFRGRTRSREAPGLVTTAPSSAPTLTSISPSSGTTAGGTFVTLTGTNFIAGGLAATIGGSAVTSLTLVNSTSLTGVTPAHAGGASDVVVTTSAGSDTLTNGYTYGTPSCPELSQFFNSNEPIDANTLFADDFCRGYWYNAISNGDVSDAYYYGQTTPDPAGAVRAVSPPFSASDYVSTTGPADGSNGGPCNAQHAWAESVTEAWIRRYLFICNNYIGGHEKMVEWCYGGFPAGGGQALALDYNYFGSGQVRGIPYLHQDDGLPSNPNGNAWLTYNVGAANWWQTNAAMVVTFTTGHWYFLEVHVKLNTPGSYDGEWDMWMDDLGTDGLSGPGTPTLRSHYTNVKYVETGAEATRMLTGLWLNNWANPGTTGERYLANGYASKGGSIGYAA